MEEMESAVDTNIKQENLNNNQQNMEPEFRGGPYFQKITNEEIGALFENNEGNLRYYLGLKEALRESRRRGEQCWCDPRDTRMKERVEQSQWRPRVVVRLLDDLSSSESGTYGFSSKQTALDDKEGNDDDNDDVLGEGTKDAGDDGAVRESDGASDGFSCGVHGCTQRFSSLASYESHYHACHSFVCATCKRKFVSNFLLDVHLQENHDSYFQILCPRIDMYRCLVESCDRKFRTPELRKDHLVTDHKYPANFSFHKPIKPKSKKSKAAGGSTLSSPKHMLNNSMESSVDSSPPSSLVSQSSPSASESSSSAMEVEPRDQHRPPQQSGATGKRGKGNRDSRGRGRKVPSVVCFGRGSQRAFQPRGRGGKGRHWHQMGAMDVDTSVDIEKVDFGDMVDSLWECT